jgi:hypothetical protein
VGQGGRQPPTSPYRRTPTAVAELRAAGLTVRDVAQLLGVTPSRISQIEKQGHLANPVSRPHDQAAAGPPLFGTVRIQDLLWHPGERHDSTSALRLEGSSGRRRRGLGLRGMRPFVLSVTPTRSTCSSPGCGGSSNPPAASSARWRAWIGRFANLVTPTRTSMRWKGSDIGLPGGVRLAARVRIPAPVVPDIEPAWCRLSPRSSVCRRG